MSDRSASNPTEKPTPERIKKARQEGQVPTSTEIPSAMVIVMLLVVLALASPMLLHWLLRQLQDGACLRQATTTAAPDFVRLLRDRALDCLLVLSPFLLGAIAVSIFSSFLTSGWVYSPKALKIDWSRLSPAKGFQSMFSGRSVMEVVVSVAKLAVLGGIVWRYLHDKLDACLRLMWATPHAALTQMGQVVFGLLARVAVGLAVIAAVDLLYQKWRNYKQLRMTRQEIKDERKQHELSPEIRGRIRAVQFEMVRRRMFQDVPKSDVVLANPTHLAIAIRYDRANMEAPQVVAKGPDLLAERIKEIARAHQIPVLYRPELTRALYAACEVGQAIPETLFIAVAEILALIYRLRKGHPDFRPILGEA